MTVLAHSPAVQDPCCCREPVIDVSREDHVARRIYCPRHRIWIAAQEGMS